VARILAKSADELHRTDIPQPMLDVLAASKVGRIHLLARRGPLQAKFTAPELRDLGRLDNADVRVRPEQVDIDPAGEAMAGAERAARTNLKVLTEWAGRPARDVPRSVELRFWVRPLEVLGEDRAMGLRVEETELDAQGRIRGTGAFDTVDAGMVFRSIGYAGVPLPGLPFDEKTRTVPHSEGRVCGTDGRVRSGDYVAGWVKRGPTGVIGTNKKDSQETVDTLIIDLAGRELPDFTWERTDRAADLRTAVGA